MTLGIGPLVTHSPSGRTPSPEVDDSETTQIIDLTIEGNFRWTASRSLHFGANLCRANADETIPRSLSHRTKITFPSYTTMVNHSHNSLDDERLWKAANPNLTALQDIISAHFRLPCCHYAPLGGGAYARIFLFTLEDGQQVVGRIVLPVRETVKTEAEVASMVYVRGTVRHYFTTIPLESFFT